MPTTPTTPPATSAAAPREAKRALRRERLRLYSGLLSGFACMVGGADLLAAGKVRVGSVTFVAGLLAAGLPPLVRWLRSRRRGG